jgi:hypothetical protein
LKPLIEAFCKPGDVVLDPFAGSGSTCLAAQRLGRQYIGIELDRHHYGTATDRLAQAWRTSITATLRWLQCGVLRLRYASEMDVLKMLSEQRQDRTPN